MKIMSFNINGIRARLVQLQAVINTHQPAIIGLQETKVHDNEFPLAAIENMGYKVAYHGQKGHYGVALLSKQELQAVQKGFPNDAPAAQRRFITGQYPLSDGRVLHVMNGYFPQGESREHPEKFPAKQQFYADLQAFLNSQFKPEDLLVVMGDMNVAPLDADIGIGADNAKRWLRTGKCSFLPEEREWLERLMQWGLHDSFRQQYPDDTQQFSWFDYRSKGFDREPRRGLRIDLILTTAAVQAQCRTTGIDEVARGMEKPSDHCPIWAALDL